MEYFDFAALILSAVSFGISIFAFRKTEELKNDIDLVSYCYGQEKKDFEVLLTFCNLLQKETNELEENGSNDDSYDDDYDDYDDYSCDDDGSDDELDDYEAAQPCEDKASFKDIEEELRNINSDSDLKVVGLIFKADSYKPK